MPTSPKGCCGYFTFLDQAVKEFEHGLDSIFKEPVDTLELDASFDKPDAIAFSGFCADYMSDTSKLHLASSIKSDQLWYQTVILLLLISLAGKMTASKLIHHFWVILQHLDSRLPLPNDIVLNAANKKSNQSLPDFQTGISVAPCAILETEQLISHMTTVLMGTIMCAGF